MISRKPFDLLRLRIKKDFGLTCHKFLRTRSGPYQRAAGAWKWRAYIKYPGQRAITLIGSCETVDDLLKAKQLTLWHQDWGDTEIFIK